MRIDNTKTLKERRHLRVQGLVQGVGFRPFVYLLATQEGLNGSVLNDGQGVFIALEGTVAQQERFLYRLTHELPRLASIESIHTEKANWVGDGDFRIEFSEHNEVTTGITPDAAVCPECLQELFNPNNRRYRYPFINCTHCGPRFTITAHLPYDRPQTSMKNFVMCPSCQAEYDSPLDRRFHAQPNACSQCGPQIELVDRHGQNMADEDVIAETIRRLHLGEIIAIKGLGGFHLVCDAKNKTAVAKLRERKAREAKPFAVMVANTLSAEPFVTISPAQALALNAIEAPIVLCDKLACTDTLLSGVAPDLPCVGVLLPYTPIHWLLFHEAAGRPAGTEWLKKHQELTLVMTSANPAGEPLVTSNKEALSRLAGIADAYLMHNRDILLRCDDSVVQVPDEHLRFIRRARGYTPRAIELAYTGPSVLATGAYLKNTACLTRETHAYLTQHIGELDKPSNCMALKEAIEHLIAVLEIHPQFIACDKHPDFYSSRLAEELANQWDIELFPVQHHHAHIAAVMAENKLSEPVLGLALDGVGFGEDGTAWGGELLRVDPLGFKRYGHLQTLRMPGGDICARQGWRMAASLLFDQANQCDLSDRFNQPSIGTVQQMLAHNLPMPKTSSLGRWFDAASAIIGCCEVSRYEGEAPMLLEGLARHQTGEDLSHLVLINDTVLDPTPLLLTLSTYQDKSQAAADFHTSLAKALTHWAVQASQQCDIRKIALAGGCIMNQLLRSQLVENLKQAHLQVFEATKAPPNDGSIALGQAWVVLMQQSFKKS